MAINPIYDIDGYKTGHIHQFPKGTEYVYTNGIFRSNKYFPQTNEVVVFGLQYFIKEYLIKQFNKKFFGKDKNKILNEYKTFMENYLQVSDYNVDHLSDLHDLGYLPLKIKALPEGSKVPIGVPVFTIINTDKRFYWLTNYIETILSNIIWLPMTSATTAKLYREELQRHAIKTGFGDAVFLDFLIHDFSMRGMSGLDASITSGMGHLTSFRGSETIPAIYLMNKYYPCDNLVASTIPASEHAVMCAYGSGNELDAYRELITKTYPNGYVAIVSDTYDFWKVLTDYTVELKKEILARDGRVVFRPDSGIPEDIICGVNLSKYEDRADRISSCGDGSKYFYSIDDITMEEFCFESFTGAEVKGAYEILWDIFGGSINKEGYKVLNPKVGIIYGDSITLERQKKIYKRLEEKGFCASNLVLGVGSYTYQNRTRDSLGFAIKATWCVVNGDERELFKDPKTVVGMSKKSLKGLVRVDLDENNKYYVTDCVTKEEEEKGCLEVVFKDGKLIKEFTLEEIRERLCKN